jgi:hypothetical protein
VRRHILLSVFICAVLLLIATYSSTLRAQQQGPSTGVRVYQSGAVKESVMFSFERSGLPVPKYSLALWEFGEGHYGGEEVPPGAQPFDPPPVAQPFGMKIFYISPATAANVFARARQLKRFNIPCASTAKNVADTGKKTLTYNGLDATTACTYDYTENKDVQTLTDIFQGIAETLDEGRKLDYLHRYDRLGMDAEMETFSREVTDGHAIELQTIAPTLRSIADDADLMQRVRTRANALLTLVPAQSRQAAQ